MANERVTLRDVYEIVERLELKVDSKIGKIDARVDVIENFQSRALGILSFLTFLISMSAGAIWNTILGRK